MITQLGVPQFGAMTYGGGDPVVESAIIGLFIAIVGDISSHGGVIVSSGQDGKTKCSGAAIAVDGAQHVCPIQGHGMTEITAITKKSKINGKLIVTYGATAGCEAIIIPKNRKVTVEK